MKKKVFLLLVILMSLSLIGIISVQAYYISNSLESKEDQFKFNIKKALSNVSNEIGEEEYRDIVIKLRKSINQGNKVNVDTTAFIDLYVKKDIEDTDETLEYKYGILEENHKFSSKLFDIGSDTTNVKRIISERETKVYKSSSIDGTEVSVINSGVSIMDDINFKPFYKIYTSRRPIHKRVSVEKINRLLKLQLLKDNIDINFEFAIYSNDLATKVKTENFNYEHAYMSVPFFDNKSINTNTNYNLIVEFPEKQEFIWSSIIGITLLSIIFTAIIIIAFVGALLQLMKQKQISEIKTDFINNMTHEFKTPIATINLALDSIKNPKIIEDKDKVKRYLQMIREENKRMHAQVENVLRISKLEKNELNISKENISLHDLIEDAISHVALIVEDRGGTICTVLKANKTTILANETHFTNVLVNILDNAIKYSPKAPVITIETLNVANSIIVNVKDKGSGMSKTAVKRVFEKFYREHTGNVHNVKGHGLGLAYVKRLVDDHQGHISVESEKDKGSTFTIKLPLIS